MKLCVTLLPQHKNYITRDAYVIDGICKNHIKYYNYKFSVKLSPDKSKFQSCFAVNSLRLIRLKTVTLNMSDSHDTPVCGMFPIHELMIN